MGSITHGGITVITNAEGGWKYTPGHKGNARQVRKLARSRRVRIAEMALEPARHRLDITWLGPNEEEWENFLSRLDVLYLAGQGTLVVPGYPVVPNAVFVGQPTFSEQTCVEEGYLYEVGLELLQT